MIKMLSGNAVWQLIKQSDIISKLVLLVLLVMSIICWTIFIYKIIVLRLKKKHLAKVTAEIKNATTLEQLLTVTAHNSGTLPGYFLLKNVAGLKELLETSATRDGQALLTAAQYEALQNQVMQSIDDCMYRQEKYVPFLSTSAAVSPLLGLFGTVWGLIHAFINISQKQSADIATVAPGIAEALITTLAGLIVAIPAFAMFNYINVQIRHCEEELVGLATRFMVVVQRTLIR